MLDVSIKIDANAAMAALDRVSDPRQVEAMAPFIADQVVLPYLRNEPSPSGKAQPFVSDRQRRYFFAALRAGKIHVPYRRTHHLGTNWTKQPFSGGLTLQSGEDYSEIVIGEQQAKYFKGTWQTIVMIALVCEPGAAQAATDFLIKLIGDAGP